MLAKILISLLIFQIEHYDWLVYSLGLEKMADYYEQISELQEIFIEQSIPDTFSLYSFDAFKEKSVIFMGTHNSDFLKKFLSQILPIRFKKDSVFIKDSIIVADDYVFTSRLKVPFSKQGEFYIIIANNPKDILASFSPASSNEFTLNRTRNGMMYEDELICKGKLTEKNSKLSIGEVIWFPTTAPEDLRVDGLGSIKLFWDPKLLNKSQSKQFLILMKTMYEAYKIQYGLVMPDTVYVYLYLSSSDRLRFNLYSNPLGIIWSKVEDRERFLSSSSLIVSFAHEFARITFQPFIYDSQQRYPRSLGADDWSHYAPMVGVVPYVYKNLGDRAWFGEDDYEKYGIPQFKKWYTGAKNTYSWLLYEIDKKYGKKLIGKVINIVKNYKSYGHPDMENFMQELARETGNKDLITKVKKAIPTPFEHSLLRRKRWHPFGFYPSLGEMFKRHKFRIDSVKKFSQADSVGLEPGDIILEIEEYDLDKEKANCYKSLIFKNPGDGIKFKVERRGKLYDFTLKIRKIIEK